MPGPHTPSTAPQPCRAGDACGLWEQKELAVAGKSIEGGALQEPRDPRREPPESRDPAGVWGALHGPGWRRDAQPRSRAGSTVSRGQGGCRLWLIRGTSPPWSWPHLAAGQAQADSPQTHLNRLGKDRAGRASLPEKAKPGTEK